MPTSKPSTLVDFPFNTPLEAVRFESERDAPHLPLGSFQDYVLAVLKGDGLQGSTLKSLLRDRGTGNFHRKYVEFRRPGPPDLELPGLVVKRDQRG